MRTFNLRQPVRPTRSDLISDKETFRVLPFSLPRRHLTNLANGPAKWNIPGTSPGMDKKSFSLPFPMNISECPAVKLTIRNL